MFVSVLDLSGGTLEKIALSKAGIMKHNCPVVSGYQCHDLVEVVLKREADKLDCPLVAASDKSMSILSLHEELHPSKPFQLVHMSLKGLEHEGGEWKERIKLGLLVSRLVISIPSSMLPVAAPHQVLPVPYTVPDLLLVTCSAKWI